MGTIGVWTAELGRASATRARWYVEELDRMGAMVLWVPEGQGGKEIFSHVAILLAASARIVIASGIASIWARDAHAAANGARALGDAYPGRVVLGLGVSHAAAVRKRGGSYQRPLSSMRAYLDAMDRAQYAGPDPKIAVPRMVGANGPQMLRLAAERTTGAQSYFVPVEHTNQARNILGPDSVLAVTQAVILETDPQRARLVAREYTSRYLALDNYRRNLLRLGFSGADLDRGGSDIIVDALVAWGNRDALRDRIRRHINAGADHVCVQVLGEDGLLDEVRVLEQLMPPD